MSTSSESSSVYNDFLAKDCNSIDSDNDMLTAARHDPPKFLVNQKNRDAKDHGGLASGGLNGFLAPFRTCCFTSSSLSVASRGFLHSFQSDPDTFTARTILQHDESFDEPSTETSTDQEEILLGTTPQIVDINAFRKSYSSTEENFKMEQLDEEILKCLSEVKLAPKQLCNTSALDSQAKRITSISLKSVVKSPWLSYTEDQIRYITLRWCSQLEYNESINLDTLKKLVLRQNATKHLTVEEALKQDENFSCLEFIRLVETRIIEEIIGELQSAATTATNTISIYFIISNIRTVVISCRQQGEALLIYVFDTGISFSRGPAFLAFDNITATEEYLIALYKTDPLVVSSTQKFKAWTLSTHPVIYTGESNHAVLNSHQKTNESLESTETVDPIMLKDPQYDANLMYAKMYKATKLEGSEKDNVFTRSAAGGVEIQKARKNKHMT